MFATFLSKRLIEDVMAHYEKMNRYDFVVKPSLPILFFGDLESFVNQSKKIVTVGLNPSDTEFRSSSDENGSYFRFPEYKNSGETLVKSLNNYFKWKPYDSWFKGSFERFLNGLECSYYPNHSYDKVLHTDIGSPLATNPTWSNLSQDQKSLLTKDGFEFWKRLMVEIKPDLIVLSVAKFYLDQLNLFSKEIIHSVYHTKEANLRKKPYNLEKYRVQIDNFETNLVFGKAANKPLGLISHSEKIKMGEVCLKTFF
ncbi:MAG: hypothetical protein OXE77_04515 [Flavobacteriaceae bacterium]|nr:hypothetical protein [Flavobacteriaceae bacterium]